MKNLKGRLDELDKNMADIIGALFWGSIISFWVFVTPGVIDRFKNEGRKNNGHKGCFRPH